MSAVVLTVLALVLSSGCARDDAEAQQEELGLVGCSSLGLTASDRTSTDGLAYTLYTGLIPSFDGVPLDVSLAVPRVSATLPPLVVMLHGYGSQKTAFHAAATTDNETYNLLSFVSRGYAAMAYTARGFHGSCGRETRGACAKGYIRLFDRRYEVRDTKHLAGLVADACLADPKRVGVIGHSYGGAQAALLALEGNHVTTMSATNPNRATLERWISPGGQKMQLRAAVSIIPPADAFSALLPNGRASDDLLLADGDRIHPYGVFKHSYVSGFFALGLANGRYAPAGTDSTADVEGWYAVASAGEPYRAENPKFAELVEQLRTWRSPLYQDALIARAVALGETVPIHFAAGWTDELFPAGYLVPLVNKLRRAYPGWPIGLTLGDFGHPIAADKPAEVRAYMARAHAFLDAYLLDAGSPPLDVESRFTVCGAEPGAAISAPTYAGLTTGARRFTSSEPRATSSSPFDPEASVTGDPIVGGRGCIVVGPARGATARWNFPLASDLVMVGSPVVELDVVVAGLDVTLAPLLWDVAPDGRRTLVSRGVYRYSGTGGATQVVTALEGNAYVVPAGHELQLEVTQNDAPHVRVNNFPSAVTYSAAAVTVPTR